MIEIKLSQGAKPAHGGILPADKITDEISEARGLGDGPWTEDCASPPYHSAFNSPKGLCHFIKELRNLSSGKPIGFKLCIGSPVEVRMGKKLSSVAKLLVAMPLTKHFHC